MLKFEEELENFKVLPEIDEAEKVISSEPLADMVDILKELTGLSTGKNGEG